MEQIYQGKLYMWPELKLTKKLDATVKTRLSFSKKKLCLKLSQLWLWDFFFQMKKLEAIREWKHLWRIQRFKS